MSDRREQILAIVSKACVNSDDPCDVCGQRADAVMAVVQPEIDRLTKERAHVEHDPHCMCRACYWRIRAEKAEAERDLAIAHDRQPYPTAWAYEQAVKALETQRERAERAEAERDRLRARLTGVAIHAHRLANRIQPGTDAWAVLADLRAALAQPGDQEGTTP